MIALHKKQNENSEVHTTTPHKKAAVFLDRDGTLIHDVGDLKNPADISLFPDTIPALKKLQETYELFVITNQSAVGAGRMSLEEVDDIHNALAAMLSDAGITITNWYVCPHTKEDNCNCRKPKTTFLEEAALQYNLDLSRSFTIGDHPHDAEMAETAGAFGLYVITGHGVKHLPELSPEIITFHSLAQAADWIITHPEPHSYLQEIVTAGAQQIRNGGLVAFPTETVYGLGADAYNAEAAAKIFAAKQRPLFDPLIVHISDRDQLDGLVTEIPETAHKLIAAFWPGPLTLVLPKSPSVPGIITSEGSTVAVRMPLHPIARKLIALSGTPIAAPSANLFGRTSPTTAQHVFEQLGDVVSTIIDGGVCRVGLESTVLSLVQNPPVLLRPGGISREQIEAVIGPIQVRELSSKETLASPGCLPSHYAPITPVIVVKDITPYLDDPGVGLLLFSKPEKPCRGPVELLTTQGDLSEVAIRLYAGLRSLDDKELRLLVIEESPGNGIGAAIRDRIQRASAKR